MVTYGKQKDVTKTIEGRGDVTANVFGADRIIVRGPYDVERQLLSETSTSKSSHVPHRNETI